MDSDAEIDAAVVRHANIALDEAILHRNGAAHGLDHAAKFGDEPIASALDYPPAMVGDGRINQIAAQRGAAIASGPRPRPRADCSRRRPPPGSQQSSGLRTWGAALTHHAIPQERFDPRVRRSKRSGKKARWRSAQNRSIPHQLAY